jgi:nucleoside-diphosphate-sugar epimerase
LSKLIPFVESSGLEIVEVDLTDREGLSATVEGVDAVVHFGAKLGSTTHFEQLDINTAPTLTLLEAVRTRNPGLKRFVYGSSDTLFPHTGYMPELITLDDIFRKPRSTYAVSKIAGGAFVDCYQQMAGIPTVTLYIPYTFCGREFLGERVQAISPLIESHLADLEHRPPSPERDGAIAELREAFADGKRLVIPICKEGPPHKHHLGDVRDVARATLSALDNETAIGGSFIVMSKPYHSDIATKHLAAVSGLDYAEILFPYSQFYEYDVSHTSEKLGFDPEYDGSQMLEDAWRQKHGEDIGVVDVG